jgi:uncharacterized protein (TIGR02099 family)
MWSLFATSVVLFAVFVSVLKYSLPHVDYYRTDLETVIKQRYGADVSIGQIGASWQSFGPVIVISDAKLNASVEAPLALSVKEILVEIDFWQSIVQQRFVSGAFLLDGAEVSIDSSALWHSSPSSKGSEFFDTISHLFLAQLQHFKVIDSRVIVRHQFGATQAYQIDSLNWLNSGLRHQGSGDVYVDGFSNNSVSLIVDLYGQRREDIFGQVYLEANKIDISPWIAPLISDHVDMLSSDANFKAWVDIQEGTIGDMLVDFDPSGIQWLEGDKKRYLGIADTKLQWWQSQDSWLIFSENVKLSDAKSEFPGFGVAFYYDQQHMQLEFTDTDLSAFSGLFSLFSLTKEQVNLTGANMQGKLKSLALHWDENNVMSAKWQAEHLSFLPPVQENSAYFGFQDLTLQGFWHQNNGWFSLSGKDGQFATNDTFSKPITYSNFLAQASVSVKDNFIDVQLPQILIENADLTAQLRGQWVSSDQQHLSLYGEILGPNQGTINQYLPKYVLSNETHDYLNRAIQQGRAELVQLVIDGDMNGFPFSNHNKNKELGRFIVKAQLKDSIFRFAPDWPALENMDANLIVDNDLMQINVLDAEFSGMTVNNDASATIDLGSSSTEVEVNIRPRKLVFSEFHDLVNDTPLQPIIGDVFEFVKVTGIGDADVSLVIPLDERDVSVSGVVNTFNSELSLNEIGIQIDAMNAQVAFNGSEFSVKGESGKLFELPISFDVYGNQSDSGYGISSHIYSDVLLDEVKAHYPLKSLDYFSGSGEAQVDVTVNIEEQGFQYFVDGNLDLSNLAYDVAAPLKHDVGTPLQLSFDMVGDQTGSDLLLSIPEQVYFQGLMQQDIPGIAAAHLKLGQDSFTLPTYGFDISFTLKETEFQPIFGFVLDLMKDINSSEPSSEPLLASPKIISGTVDKLDLVGLEWNNVSLNAVPKQDHWLFSVGAKQTLTDIKLYNDESKPIEIKSKFLKIETENYLRELDGLEPLIEDESIEPTRMADSAGLIRSLPKFDIYCSFCEVNGKPLGELSLLTKTAGPELLVDKFTMRYKRNSVDLTGRWVGDSASGRTMLNGKIKSRYFGSWLSELGFNTGIKESEANVDLNLQWKAAPFEMKAKELNGSLKFNLGDGYLSEISDQGARIFSLFSLDSLYRKLKFDFNDVFNKGLFYNSIRGEVAIKDGVAYTDNTVMDGVAGNMAIVGETDLVQKDINYDVSFKPKVMSSLPIITAVTVGAAYTNPLTWLGLLVFDKALDDVDVVSEIKLSVTGPLEEPKVEEVKRFTKRITLTEEEKKRLRELGVQAKQEEQSTSQKQEQD